MFVGPSPQWDEPLWGQKLLRPDPLRVDQRLMHLVPVPSIAAINPLAAAQRW